MATEPKPDLVAAEFDSPERAIAAAKRLVALGVGAIEAYTPFPVEELEAVLARPRPRIPMFVFLAGLSGLAGAVGLQHWLNAIDYPVLVGGRPLASFPTYVVIGFEATVLSASLVAFLAVLLGVKLPRLHDPIFDLPGFERATVDRFWLTIAPAPRTRVNDLRDALAEAVALHGVEE